MKRIVIIGAGISGLASAVYLAQEGHKITLIEKSGLPGGRARSFRDPKTGDLIDNGQHLMIGCYKETLDFIKTIGAENEYKIFDKLFIPFVHRGGRTSYLSVKSKFYPFNLVTAILRYDALNFKERVKILSLLLKNKIFKYELNCTVDKFLKKKNQSENSIKYFWNILVESMLNTSIEEADANLFFNILREVFENNFSSKFIIAEKSLFDLFAKKSIEFLKKYDTEILFNENVKSVKIENEKVVEIKTSKRVLNDFDLVVSSIPLTNLKRLNPKFNIDDFEYNSITSIYLWLKDNPFKENYYCLLNSDYHWLFNHGKFICLLTSNSQKYTDIQSIDNCKNELQEYFPYFVDDLIIDYRIIEEKRATISLTQNAQLLRKNLDINLYDFYIIGDWTNTGLPGTLESAVKSSKNVLDLIS